MDDERAFLADAGDDKKAPTSGAFAVKGPVNIFGMAPRGRISPPIHLAHYRRKWPPYLPRPADRDIIAAVVVQTAYRRKTFPATMHDAAWCNKHDKPLGAYLESVSDRSAWSDLHEQRRGVGEFAVGQLVPMPIPKPEERRLAGETLASFAKALPRLRGLGELVLEEREEAKRKPEAKPTADSKGEGGGSGGKKAKVKATPDEVAETEDADLLLTEEELEEIERMRLKP